MPSLDLTAYCFPLRKQPHGRCIEERRDLDERLGIVAVVITCLRARAAGVLPFRLSRQAVLLAFLLAQPLAESRAIAPRHIDYRVIVRLAKTWISPGVLQLAALQRT